MIILSIFSIIPFTIISVTSIWTFLFTHGFLRKNLRRHKRTLNAENLEAQKHIYSERVRNLIGIFGMLLLFNVLTLSPFLVASIVGLIVGLDRVPRQVYASVFVLLLFNNVSNPIIQAYFRKDLLDTLKKYLMRVKMICKMRRVEDQQVVMTRKSGMNELSLESGVGNREGGSVEKGVCEGVTVVEVRGHGRESREVQISCNGSSVQFAISPSGNLESTITEGNTGLSVVVEDMCRGGGEGEEGEDGGEGGETGRRGGEEEGRGEGETGRGGGERMKHEERVEVIIKMEETEEKGNSNAAKIQLSPAILSDDCSTID